MPKVTTAKVSYSSIGCLPGYMKVTFRAGALGYGRILYTTTYRLTEEGAIAANDRAIKELKAQGYNTIRTPANIRKWI